MRVRGVLVLAGLALIGLAACGQGPQQPDPSRCVDLYRQYDRLERSGQRPRLDQGTQMLPGDLERQTRLLVINDCLTLSADIDGLEDLAARNKDLRIVHGGAAISPPVPVQLGVLTAIQDESRVTRIFRGFGYRSRGEGAEGLGRRIYIGPFTDQAAIDQALELAREAGFVAPYAATQVRF